MAIYDPSFDHRDYIPCIPPHLGSYIFLSVALGVTALTLVLVMAIACIRFCCCKNRNKPLAQSYRYSQVWVFFLNFYSTYYTNDFH